MENRPRNKGQSIVGFDPLNRDEDDFYPSPPHTIHDLMRVESFGPSCWEPACGSGHMSIELEKYFSSVLSSDIKDRGYGHNGINFLTYPNYFFDIFKETPSTIITNPPYNKAEEFVRTSLGAVNPDNGKVAMLLKLVFLESQERYRLFRETPLKKVYVYSKRLKISRRGEEIKGSSMIAFAWFVWDQSYKDEPTIDWILHNEDKDTIKVDEW